jgi:hypothetical protein
MKTDQYYVQFARRYALGRSLVPQVYGRFRRMYVIAALFAFGHAIGGGATATSKLIPG